MCSHFPPPSPFSGRILIFVYNLPPCFRNLLWVQYTKLKSSWKKCINQKTWGRFCSSEIGDQILPKVFHFMHLCPGGFQFCILKTADSEGLSNSGWAMEVASWINKHGIRALCGNIKSSHHCCNSSKKCWSNMSSFSFPLQPGLIYLVLFNKCHRSSGAVPEIVFHYFINCFSHYFIRHTTCL